jgi:hypothetical protein
MVRDVNRYLWDILGFPNSLSWWGYQMKTINIVVV